MSELYFRKIADEIGVAPAQVAATAGLLGEGGTVPFIARYRKEATGGLDEVAITAVRDRLEQLAELDKRREAILQSLEERGLLSDELRAKVTEADSITVLEDIYLPYRPKRRTRAMIAKEKGLEPLALLIFTQDGSDPLSAAAKFVSEEKGVPDTDAALAGARDIIAEMVSEDQNAREAMRSLFAEKAVLRSRMVAGKEEAGAKYKDYFEWEEPASKAPSHRILAIRRGETEGFLILRVLPAEDESMALLERMFLKNDGSAASEVRKALQDGYRRLLSAAMETEIRLQLKKRADQEAIRVFVDNVRQLLLAPPLGRKNVLAIDPGFRTGCKIVCLDRQGKLLHHETVYPHFSGKGADGAGSSIAALCAKFSIEAIAIGNGTAGRETETWIRSLGLDQSIAVVMVNESGASIYSASETAREEFPSHDVTVRGSVSIGRRLMDPLSELVKIDPKSIGVGQYQHDVDQNALRKSLDDVVVSCVNGVGVELNTASKQLLSYVSGLGPQLAKNIVEYRDSHGPFRSREELRSVPRMGPKAFEQSAGFLRIRDGENPLDASAVHPESYHLVDAMATDLGCSPLDLLQNREVREKVEIARYVTDRVGLPTLTDIMSELAKPGRDPREQFESYSFAAGIEKIEDVQPGMKLPGVVTNITAFGVFVDIGVHQDGLVHISELADRYVKNPADVVKVHQRVQVTVKEVDLQRKRIALSMKSGAPQTERPAQAKPEKSAPPVKTAKPVPPPKFSNNPFFDAFNKKRGK